MTFKSYAKRLISAFFALLFVISCFTVQTSAVTAPQGLHSKSCLIYNLETETILYGVAIDEEVYPTSTVKIIAGMLALEYYENQLDKILTVPAEALAGAMGTSISLRAGEEISVRDLLYAVLVAGANDAVCVLAYHIAGNVTAFVNMMNEKVRELGCKNTFYTNCTGVHDVNMVTTAADTLKIALYAYTNSNFMAMSSETSYTIAPTNKTTKERKIYNRNFIVSTQYYTLYYNSLAKGMNAGYTSDGGYCLVTSLRKKGCTYIVVCMGARTDPETQRIHTYTDCETLVNWAYDNYDFVSLVDQTTMICELPVTLSSDVDYVTLLPAEPIEMFLPKDIDVSTAVKLNYILLADSIEAPIKEGEIAGVLTAHYNDKPVATVNLVTKDNVSRSEFLYFLTTVRGIVTHPLFYIIVAIAILLALFFVFFKAVYLEKARRKAMRRKQPNLSRKH